MKRSFTLAMAFVVALWVSGLTPASAQKGRGKPATTGLEHAEQTANPKGVSHGIENAEAKQGKEEDKDAPNKGKHKGKSKGKKTRTRKHKKAS